MTVAAKLRETLFKAKEYMEKKDAAGDDASKKPGFDMKMEAMLPVIAARSRSKPTPTAATTS